MLRALPPASGRSSYTTTANPRAASSWAAVIPATPPPRTITLLATSRRLSHAPDRSGRDSAAPVADEPTTAADHVRAQTLRRPAPPGVTPTRRDFSRTSFRR